MIEPAAPYPEPGFAVPKYNPKADFPISKNNAVMNGPILTCRHYIFASGKDLNLSANNTASMPSDKIKLMISNTMSRDSEK